MKIIDYDDRIIVDCPNCKCLYAHSRAPIVYCPKCNSIREMNPEPPFLRVVETKYAEGFPLKSEVVKE